MFKANEINSGFLGWGIYQSQWSHSNSCSLGIGRQTFRIAFVVDDMGMSDTAHLTESGMTISANSV